ncbi:hypothetical protein QWJ90_01210 [Microbacterium oryzae]|uniref:hypothetical protein n=1 Tax=Microbacterium oryzae TaxID=743009 RepID=UPI0025AF5508|nr:hypothetical protein [Microbacterium oryzae]MDN3309540.1 hypothetical protein [Microbacterium oryzae]
MDKREAAHNRLKTAIETALAEAAGHKGRIRIEDQNHAREITQEIDRLIALHAAGSLDENYG